MDNGNKHDGDEVDIFDLAGARPAPVSSEEHIETETNVFLVDTLRQAASQRGGLDTGAFEVSAPAQTDGGASDGADFDVSAAAPTRSDPIDDDVPRKKGGFFSKLFRRGADGGGNEEAEDKDSDELSLDEGMFIAPPQVSGRTSAAANQPPAEAVVEPETAATVPEVTDSGVFEFGPAVNTVSTDNDTDNAVSAVSDELPAVSTVPEVTDSGVFEFGPAVSTVGTDNDNDTDNAVSAVSDEPAVVATVPEVTDSGVFEFGPAVNTVSTDNDNDTDNAVSAVSDEPAVVATVPEVTDSGVFEFGPAVNTVGTDNDNDTDNAVSAASDEPPAVSTVPEVTDSGVFEFGPAVNTVGTDNDNDNAVSAANDEPPAVSTVPEVTDSGVFELAPSPAPAAPVKPQGAQKGDEWEIGWEPQDDGAGAEFDVSGGSEAAAAEAAAETPPPVFTKLAHVCIYVKDLGRSVEFYSKLGFRKRFVFNRNGSLFGVYLEFGDGNFIELFEDMARSSAAALGRLAHFCLETPDIDAATESLSARGIEFTPKKLGRDSTYQIWLKDPDGNEFEIHQYTANSSQIIGGEVEADW